MSKMLQPTFCFERLFVYFVISNYFTRDLAKKLCKMKMDPDKDFLQKNVNSTCSSDICINVIKYAGSDVH